MRILERWTRLLIAHPKSFALLFGLLTVAASAGLGRLVVDFNTADFFASSDPARTALDAFKAEFGRDDTRLVVLVEGDDVLSADGVTYIAQLTEALEGLSFVKRVDSLTTVSDMGASGSDAIDTSPVLWPLPADPLELKRRQARVLQSPLFKGRLLAADSTLTAIVAEIDIESESVEPLMVFISEVRVLLKKHAHTHFKTHLAGVPFLRAESVGLIKDEQARLTALNVIVIGIFLLLFFRTLHGVLIPLFAVLSSVASTVGLMGWFGLTGDMINLATPSLLLVIGVADAVHVVVRFHEEWEEGVDKREAIVRSMRHVGVACFLTSVTTAIGFASLGAATMTILQKFGWISAMGVAITYFGVIAWLPLLLLLCKKRVHSGHGNDYTSRALNLCLGLVKKRGPVILLVGLVVCVLSIVSSSELKIDARLTSIHPAEHPSLAVNRKFESKLNGVIPIEVWVRGAEHDLLEPKVLHAMKEVEDWLVARPEIGSTVSLPMLITEMHRAFTGKAEIPDNRPLISQLLLIAEGDPSLEQIFAVEHDSARISAVGADIGAHRQMAMVRELDAFVAERFDKLPVQAVVTGTSVVAYRAISNLIGDLFRSVFWALALIAVIMFAVVRDVRLGLLSLIPNCFPLVVGLGFMVVAGISLEPATSIIFAIALGIAVDDTIHFLSRLREERAKGVAIEVAIRETMMTAGRAMVYTTVVLSMGYAVIAQSAFPPLAHFGVLGAVILVAALLGDLLLLPAGILLWERFSPSK